MHILIGVGRSGLQTIIGLPVQAFTMAMTKEQMRAIVAKSKEHSKSLTAPPPPLDASGSEIEATRTDLTIECYWAIMEKMYKDGDAARDRSIAPTVENMALALRVFTYLTNHSDDGGVVEPFTYTTLCGLSAQLTSNFDRTYGTQLGGRCPR